ARSYDSGTVPDRFSSVPIDVHRAQFRVRLSENLVQEPGDIGMSGIEARALVKDFGPFRAVDGVSFKVEPGTVLGFLGPNGAGKSTTMKMLTGFLTPTAGSAVVHDHVVAAEPTAAKRRLGYLPERGPLYGEMTATEFLLFIGRARDLGGPA